MKGALLALLLGPACGARAAKPPPPEASFQNVVVKPGDTLWSIAHRYLRDPARWDEVLKYNRLPTADPTVALPGMTLRVPVRLIKENLRAARLVYVVNRVLSRRKDTADWKPSREKAELFQGDSLRTLADSRARVMFLSRELLSLEPNSMAVIKPVEREGDLELKSGSIFTGGRARVITANAKVTPRTQDTRYAASVEPDLTTRVEVFKGEAEVSAQGARVDVAAGMATRVQPGLAPEVPKPIENPAELELRGREFEAAVEVDGGATGLARAAPPSQDPEGDASSLKAEIKARAIGVPVLGYHVQAARDRDFRQLVFDKRYDTDEIFSPAQAGLAPGAYWWRTSAIDLLNVEGRFSDPRYYSVGLKQGERPEVADIGRVVILTAPNEGDVVSADTVRVAGILRNDSLALAVNGKPVRIDADGNFIVSVPIKPGLNEIIIMVSDGKGNVSRLARRVTRR